MNTFSTVSLPRFNAGQVLRHSDLNDLADYLDEQDRLTRMLLVGIGIVEGLMPRVGPDGNSLIIGSGIGISSDGYLIYVEEEWDLKYYYESNITPEQVMGVAPNPNAPSSDGVLHLLQEGERPDDVDPEDIEPLSELPNDKDYVLVLYLHRIDDDDSRCFNEVESGAAGVKYELKALLIDKAMYTLCTDTDVLSPSEVDSGSVAFDDFQQPYIRRFGYVSTTGNGGEIDLGRIDSFDDFFQNYVEILQPSFSIIETAYINAYDTYKDLLDQSPTNPFNSLAVNLENLLDIFIDEQENSAGPIGLQYFYDYLRDLISAHNEFIDSAVDLSQGGQILPEKKAHPRHVVLGVVPKSSLNLSLNTDICRTRFRSSAFHEENNGKNRKAQFLLNRMKELVKINPETDSTSGDSSIAASSNLVGSLSTANILSASGTQDSGDIICLPVTEEVTTEGLLITPSKALSEPLSERAVPVYIGASIKSKWNFFLLETGRTNTILGYHFRGGGPPYDEPLHYEMEPYSFFRVEGLVGMEVTEAYTQLDEKRKKLDLPFDFQFVKLGNDLGTLSPQRLIAEDLQKVYELTRQEICCELDKIILALKEQSETSPEEEELKGKVENLILELPKDLSAFSFVRFDQAFNELPKDENLEVEVPETECRVPVLRSLDEAFTERRGQFHLFPVYATLHQGLEHTGGVSKGGTFVAAYAEFMENGKPVCKVVGDFSLDYNCCANRGGAVQAETYLAALPAQYCSDDPAAYELVTYPLGGMLTSSIWVDDQELEIPNADSYIEPDPKTGKFYFNPGAVPVEAYTDKGWTQIELSYTKFGHTSTTRISIFQKPEFDFPVPTETELIEIDGRPISQRVTFQVTDLKPAIGDHLSLSWIVAGEPVPANNDDRQLIYDFPYSEGFNYEVRLIAKNGICRTEVAKAFAICKEDAELSLGAETTVVQGSDEVLEIAAAPTNGIFRLIEPDGHVVKPQARPKEGGELNEFEISARDLLKIGDYELIYRLPHCLKEARVQFSVRLSAIHMDKYEFCSDDNKEYLIQLEKGGRDFLEDVPGVMLQDGQPFFNPARIGPAEYNEEGFLTIVLSYVDSAGNAITRQLNVFQVPEIELVARRPLYVSDDVMNNKACILEGYTYDFQVLPAIWDNYSWLALETGKKEEGLKVSFDFRFQQGHEFRVKVEASSATLPTGGNCPLDKIELIKMPCPEVTMDLDLGVAAAIDLATGLRTLILPAPNENVPTFAIAGNTPVPIKVAPLGGVFSLTYLDEIDEGGSPLQVPAILIRNATPCEEEKIEYFLDVSNDAITPGAYRLTYWIRDCIDEKGQPLLLHIGDFDMAFQQVEIDDANPLLVEGTNRPILPKILEDRLKANRSVIEKLRGDANIPRSTAFKLAEDLLKTGNDLVSVMEAFDEAASATTKKVGGSTGKLKDGYLELLHTVVQYFFDRLVARNPIQIQDSALDLLSQVGESLKANGVDRKVILEKWNADELRTALGATITGEISQAFDPKETDS